MELVKAQRSPPSPSPSPSSPVRSMNHALLASKWAAPYILIAIITFGLLISAIFTSNFAIRITPITTATTTSSSFSSSSSSPSQTLFILFFKGTALSGDHTTTTTTTWQNGDDDDDDDDDKNEVQGDLDPPSPRLNAKPDHDERPPVRLDSSQGATKLGLGPGKKNSGPSIVIQERRGHGSSSDGESEVQNTVSSGEAGCDIWSGRGSWVQIREEDRSAGPYEHSYYHDDGPGACPFLDKGFSCQRNGRPDHGYLRWRWIPQGCGRESLDLPRFHGRRLLELMRGKRIVFVGDSLNRNQWESLLCMLRESLPDKDRIEQIRGHGSDGGISKLPGAYVFKFLDYDCKVEFYTSFYLVDQQIINESNSSRYTIRLDRMDRAERRWRKANVLIFNTGHWWTSDKIGDGSEVFQEGQHVHKKLDVMVAYKKALSTWAAWVDRHVNPRNTTVFFRSYSPIHYTGGQWNSGGQCQDETEPIHQEAYLTPYPDKMYALEETLAKMRNVRVKILNITRLSDYRKDAHPAIYGHPPGEVVRHQDCSHWCLPGLPDTWNELLYQALTMGASS